jgi:hypothetical protein
MNPDPTNKYEKRDNQDFNLKYSTDPNFISAMLSILTHYYERLQKEYNGQLKNVPCPTLEKETEEFRISQDSLHRWICQCIVASPNNEEEYDTATITLSYSEWYKNNIDRKINIKSTTFVKEIISSALGKFVKPIHNKNIVLKGCRILGNDIILREDEEYISLKSVQLNNDNKYEDWWNY